MFGAGGIWLTTRRIDGQFPNFRQLLPEPFEHELALPREELLDVVRRVVADGPAELAAPLALRRRRADGLRPDPGRRRGPRVAAGAVTGEPLEIGFNAEFLRDGLESVPRTSCAEADQPAAARRDHGEADDFVYLIMPIRLAG